MDEFKSVTVAPSATQLSKGAKALDALVHPLPLMCKLSAKEKRQVAEAIYRAMVGNPQNSVSPQGVS